MKNLMKGNARIKILAVFLAALVLLFFSFSVNSYAKKDEKDSADKNRSGTSSVLNFGTGTSNTDNAEKVYLITGADGAEKQRIVSAGGKVYYKGYEDAKVPVKVEISYELDGEKISPKKLAGKSGYLEMTIRYTKNTDAGVGKTPFLAATGMILDNGNARDVEVDNGRIMDDGSKTTILAYGFPGMENDLGLNSSEVDIPDTVNISMDVTDFEMTAMYSVATSEPFANVDLTSSTSVDDIAGKISSLEGSASQLASGTQQLAGGAAKVASGSSQLYAASKTLSDGASTLASGTQQLYSGSGKLVSGVGTLNKGAADAASGSKKLYAGVKTLGSSTDTLNKGVQGMYANLAAGITDEEKTAAAAAAKKQVDQTLASGGEASGADGIVTAIESQIASGLKNSQSTIEDSLYDGLLKSYEAGAVQGAKQGAKAISGQELNDQAAQQIAEGIVGNGELQAGLREKAKKASAQLVGSITERIREQISSSTSGNQEMKQLAEQIASQTAVQTVDSTKKTIASQMKEQGLLNGTKALAAATSSKSDLQKGMKSLSAGNAALAQGTSKLYKSSGTLVSGVVQLNNGAGKLAEGASTFSEKQGEMASGAAKLAEGADTLNAAVNSAMSKIKGEIGNLNPDQLKTVMDNLNTMEKDAKDYNRFGNKGATYDSVIFIYKADTIEKTSK